MTNTIETDIRDIKTLLITYFPFATIPMNYLRIVLSSKVTDVSVNHSGTVMINLDGWAELSTEEKRAKLLHVMFHVMFLHYRRTSGFPVDLFNYVACAKVDSVLAEVCEYDKYLSSFLMFTSTQMFKIAKALDLDVEIVKKMSVEDITGFLADNNKFIGSCDDFTDEDGYNEMIQEGSDIFVNNDEAAIKQVLANAKAFSKMAGNLPAGVAREIDSILNVKPPWELRVKLSLLGVEKNDTSYKYPNRRYDDYPGDVASGSQLYVGIDTSASISQKLLEYFLGIAMNAVKTAVVWVCPWDADSYEMIRAQNPRDVASKVAPKMKGGGGTEVGPFLAKIVKRLKPTDGVIILTDGDIFDLTETTTKALFNKVKNLSSAHMIGFTDTPVQTPGWQSFMLRGRNVPKD